jgi:5-methylcytosine-specific restriction protein A
MPTRPTSRAKQTRQRWATKQAAAAAVRRWVQTNGWVCPGWNRPPHPSRDLTADHATPLTNGGHPTDPANLTVCYCRPCNSSKGAG